MSTNIIALHGRASSLVLELSDTDLPIWRHFGARIERMGDIRTWSEITPDASFSLNENQPFRVVPLFGNGWFGPTGLEAHRNGTDWAHNCTSVKISSNKGFIEVSANDDIAGIEICWRADVEHDIDVYTFKTSVKNFSDTPLTVQKLCSGIIPVSRDFTQVNSFVGRHNNEFIPISSELTRSGWHQTNRRGLTSHDASPYARVQTPSANGFSGDVIAAHLAWSGNHTQSVDWIDYGHYVWQSGAWYSPGELILASGETLTSPDWIVTYSDKGENGAANNLQQNMRRSSPLWASGNLKPRPVHLNTWEGFYFDHDEAELKDLATSAANFGVERFILDDGWFAGRNDDTTSLGDWVPDKTKYPNGLAPLAEHVKSLGMEFGLWVEPEMVNPDSELYRVHPDWALSIDGRTPLTSRNQLVLDLTNRDTWNYLFDTLNGLLTDLPIDYLKWDHNRDLTQAGSQGRAAYNAQIHAAYALIDKLRIEHPSIEIEACAGGGGRIDAGILKRTDRVWASDCIDAVSRTRIQNGFLQYLPPEIMGSHIGASPAHSTGRMQNMDFRAAVAVTGHFGVELDPRKLSTDEAAKIIDWVGFYKSIRDVIHTGQVWQGECGDHVAWVAMGEPSNLYLFIYRLEPTEQRFSPHLKLPMLKDDKTFKINRCDPLRGSFDGYVGDAFRDIDENGAFMSGDWIKRHGISLPFMMAERCIVLRITAD